MTLEEKYGLSILFEDNHFIAINKKSGQIVQGDKTGDTPLNETIKHYLKEKYNKPGNVFCGVIHRLDRPVTGVCLFAKTSKALERSNKLFETRNVTKVYWAIVKNKPIKDEDTLIHYLVRDADKNKSKAHTKEVPNSKKSSLHYTLLSSSSNYYLIQIELQTGRHHQIRSQLQAINCPIKGDLKYGFARSNKNGGIDLHARLLKFIHPIKESEIVLTAPVPQDKLWLHFEENITKQY